MGQGVDVDAGSAGRRSGWVPGGDSITSGASRWGAAATALANDDENCAEHQVLAAAADEAEGGDVPEEGGPAVAQHDLVAVGQREQLGQARPQPPAPSTAPSAWRWLVPR